MKQTLPAVLLVEADEATRNMYQRELSQYFEVFITETETETKEALKTHDIQAIVLEPVLQQGNGWQLLSDIVQEQENRTPPIIICSTIDERKQGFELGAGAYLVKPVLPATLSQTLNRIIQPHTQAGRN